MSAAPTTSLCRHTNEAIYYREQDVVDDLMGQAGFSAVFAAHILGRRLTDGQARVLDAVMVAVMEHGLTPSAIATRLVYMSAPENLQGAVAAELMAVGSQFVGTMENCAVLIARIMAGDAATEAAAIAAEHRAARRAVPGFGHHLHKPDDPRAVKLLAIVEEEGLCASEIAALRCLAEAVDTAAGKHVTINATGAAAALLAGIGIPVSLMRGFAVISRCAGLVAHVAEEQRKPSGRAIWDIVDRAIPYAAEPVSA